MVNGKKSDETKAVAKKRTPEACIHSLFLSAWSSAVCLEQTDVDDSPSSNCMRLLSSDVVGGGSVAGCRRQPAEGGKKGEGGASFSVVAELGAPDGLSSPVVQRRRLQLTAGGYNFFFLVSRLLYFEWWTAGDLLAPG